MTLETNLGYFPKPYQAQSDVDQLSQSIGSLGIGSYVSSYQSSRLPLATTTTIRSESSISSPPANPDSPSQPMISTSSVSTAHPDHDPFHPLATATLQTTVFDVVHMFSERGISAVPIVDEDGSVIDMYESVDIVVSLGSA